MIGDRDYMRDQGGYRSPMTMKAKLIIGMVAVFAFQCVDGVYMRGAFTNYLALTRDGIRSGFIWQLFTFQVLHAGLFHLFINGFMLWIIGRYVEGILGTKRLLVAFFGCGLLGGLMQVVLMLVLPRMYGTHLVGAESKRSEDTEPSGIGHRSDQFWSSDPAHAGLYDRDRDAERRA